MIAPELVALLRKAAAQRRRRRAGDLRERLSLRQPEQPGEGVAQDGELAPIQKAFLQYGGFQCGICTPGQIMAAHALLEENPHPTEDEIKEWMMGNLCRCTGYYKILESIQKAAAGEVS